MQSSLHSTKTAFITCQSLPAIVWQPSEACSFADALAVFRVAIPPSSQAITRLENLLTPEELDYANRFVHVLDKCRFVVGRGFLRILAAKYSQQLPQNVQISIGKHGKPKLINTPGIQANISHAGHWLLLVFGRGSEQEPVGIDIEFMNQLFDYQEISKTIFTPSEHQALANSASPLPFFYKIWTRKEALLKATGTGISDDLCHVPALNGNHSVSASVIGDAGAWVVQGFWVDDAHPAAVAHRPMATEPVFYRLNTDYFP
jgi:4'-phosphopantetheinyl transferase